MNSPIEIWNHVRTLMEQEMTATTINTWFDEHREQMTTDIMRLVRFPSVSQPQEGEAPFGEACRDCLEEMLALGREHGFYTENYKNYVGSIGEQKKDWKNMIGFWNMYKR